MSEEDAFLDGIAANRTDRTRLLVFADWLADRSDRREEFVRLHARLLDMDGTEPGFLELEETWISWVGGRTQYSGSQRSWSVTSPHLTQRWLGALCRVFTADDAESYLFDDEEPQGTVKRFTSAGGPIVRSVEATLYHGSPTEFASPFEFVAASILRDVWDEPFRTDTGSREPASRRYLAPVTRGTFWRCWRECSAILPDPPPVPVPVADNHFLGAQYIEGNWDNWGMVAVHQHDYFALLWTTM